MVFHKSREMSQSYYLNKLCWVNLEEVGVGNKEHSMIRLQQVADDTVQTAIAEWFTIGTIRSPQVGEAVAARLHASFGSNPPKWHFIRGTVEVDCIHAPPIA